MLKIEREDAQQSYSGLTFQVEIPEGTMFVVIMEDITGKPIGIQIHIGKAGSTISAWSQAMARMCTLALDHGASIFELVEQLSANLTDKVRKTSENINLTSGPEGLSYALLKYHRVKRGKDIPSERRPPRLGLRRTYR